MGSTVLGLLSVLSSLLVVSADAHAMTVSPTSLHEADPTVGETELLVEASPDKEIALSIDVLNRQANGPRGEIGLPGGFQIVPPQLLLKPGTTARIRIAWPGSAFPARGTRSYWIAIEQLPIMMPNALEADSAQDRSGLTLLPRVLVPFHLGILGGQDIAIHVEESNARSVVVLENRGLGAALYKDLSIDVETVGSNEPARLDPRIIAHHSRSDALLPGETAVLPLDLFDLKGAVRAVTIKDDP